MRMLVWRQECARPADAVQCLKCGFWSGDDWEQCDGACPMEASPFYDSLTHHAFSPFHTEEPA